MRRLEDKKWRGLEEQKLRRLEDKRMSTYGKETVYSVF